MDAKETDPISFVDKKLTEWKLAEYSQVFKENEVDEEAFLIITEEQVEKLIPLIGPRSKFMENRSVYLKQKDLNSRDGSSAELDDTLSVTSSPLTDSEVSSQSASEAGSKNPEISAASATVISGERLIRLLKSCERTQVLLTKVRLTSRDRKTLCGAIVDHFLSMKKKLSAPDYEFWSKEVPAVFPHELAGTYYEPYRGGPNKRLASGKLWDRYNNEKKYIRPKKSAGTSVHSSAASDAVAPEDITAALVKLRAVSPDDTDLKELWRLTAKYRDKTVPISEYYKQYPVLTTSVGSSLIRMDFDDAGLVTDSSILIKTWARHARNIIALAKQRGICKHLLSSGEQASVETLGFVVLPYLFRTSQIQTKNRKVWRPSQPEVAEAFILQITSMGDYSKRISERLEKLYKYGLTIQPFVLTVGTPTSYTAIFVVVGDTKYECSSLMGAVDFSFKTTWALNAKYQADCEAVWSFIQRFVYEMTTDTKCNKKFLSVQTVWSDIKSLPDSEQ